LVAVSQSTNTDKFSSLKELTLDEEFSGQAKGFFLNQCDM
jgi:hypothetical protein